MNFGLGLSSDRIPGVQTDWTRLLGETGPAMESTALTTGMAGETAAVKEGKLELMLVGQPVSDRTRATVLAQFQDQAMQQQAAKNFPIRPNDYEPLAQVLNSAGLNQQVRPLDREAAMMAGLLLGSPEFQRR
jgi:CelD/BcsL family acetyltransferase involved in cellulose biosynthesis